VPERGRRALRVAVGGLGAIGAVVARRLDAGIEGLELAAVAARDAGRARERLRALRRPVPVLALDALAEHADVVVECAPASCFLDSAGPAIELGRTLVPLGVGALLEHPELIERARVTGARIRVPSGALLGLDAVCAAAEGTIHSVTLITRKPPPGLAGAPFVLERGISLEGLERPLRLYAGSVREAVRGFPANLNVAAALSLAGIGAERTRIEVWADPGVTRNIHRIEVLADSARFTLCIENLPSEENPRTGRITALSVIATLRALAAPLALC